MDHAPLFKRAIYRTISFLYAFLFFSTQRRFLGFTIGSWLKFLPLVLMLIAWIGRYSVAWLAVGLALEIGIRLLYWKAGRDGYIRFVPLSDQTSPRGSRPISDEQRLTMHATGVFGVEDWEEYLLDRPAEYWRVPRGDHAIMVLRRPGRYLYQFIQHGMLQKVESGHLLFGMHPKKALSVVFLTTWGPQFAESNVTLLIPDGNKKTDKWKRRIYLAFESDAEKESVWQNLLRDASVMKEKV